MVSREIVRRALLNRPPPATRRGVSAHTPWKGGRSGHAISVHATHRKKRGLAWATVRRLVMAYDPEMADRIRELVLTSASTSERAMFGGLCFLINGNMACGLTADSVMIRVGPDEYEAALQRPGVEEMTFTGRPMRGIVQISLATAEDPDALAEALQWGIDYAGALPPKRPKTGKSPKRKSFTPT